MEPDTIDHLDAQQNGMAAGEQDDHFDAQIDDFMAPNQDYNEEEEERKYFRRKRLAVVKNVVSASLGSSLTYGVYLGLLQMQLILHYDETYREVKYGNLGLEDIDKKMLMGINVTPIVALLYTPVLIRFLGTKWMMFLAIGIYALFVSTNYWERYYTLVPSAVAIGAAIVPLWAAVGNYITRMAQKYYEYANYKEDHVLEQKKLPKGASYQYVIIFQSIFYFLFNVSLFFFLIQRGKSAKIPAPHHRIRISIQIQKQKLLEKLWQHPRGELRVNVLHLVTFPHQTRNDRVARWHSG
ncbi:protein unc-93 homolog B1-like [Chiloscyllium punctatum]|uniref:protein unc-93 homolog B1-like n=1 Tax=Chiloscyllium punctatum TaxID=137246 RepID=UPI003B634ABC